MVLVYGSVDGTACVGSQKSERRTVGNELYRMAQNTGCSSLYSSGYHLSGLVSAVGESRWGVYDDGNPFVSCRDGGAGVGCVDCRACQYYRIGIECFEYRVYNGYLCEEDSPAGEAEGDHLGRTSGDGSRCSDIGNHNDCHWQHSRIEFIQCFPVCIGIHCTSYGGSFPFWRFLEAYDYVGC